ncbi:MAG: MBL fold metallo-hydrolase [Desulfomonile tiedjei]|uniref:MBL fold metallo-hydrolase n=1 Tax=Desulfomonile tiedjei TaxID=2358 RepID=A0A9D6UY73_9BACT|nr:MBL fold metallo-hydrolase [Desulfomonile tiedjei]
MSHFSRLFISGIVLLALGGMVMFFVQSPAEPLSAMTPHHTSHGFRNLHASGSSSFFDFLRWRWDRLWMDFPDRNSYHFPLAQTQVSFLKSNTGSATVTWIGHATLLFQIGGKNILTDPQFSERASPVQFAGPRRAVAPGIPLDDLPKIDMVVLSHDHYDSLDSNTVRRLLDREGGMDTFFFVPLGLKTWFEGMGATRVVEMDWWDKQIGDGLQIICVPVRHWSQRIPFVRNRSLWAGWVIRNDQVSVLFTGDTGYTSDFKEIGRKLGPFDIAAIPIGAYEPRWFMRHYHINPQEAVQVHLDVKARKSIGIHWGTFPLTDEPLDEPPKELEKAKRAMGLLQNDFIVLKHGETIPIKDEQQRQYVRSER